VRRGRRQGQAAALLPPDLVRVLELTAMVGFAQKVAFTSPRSGRMIVAQQFTAGTKEPKDSQSVKRTAERSPARNLLLFSRPLHGLRPRLLNNPSDESLGYFRVSANAD